MRIVKSIRAFALLLLAQILVPPVLMPQVLVPHAAFALTGADAAVFIDPFGDMSPLAQRGTQFDYPAIEGVEGINSKGDILGYDACGYFVARNTASAIAAPGSLVRFVAGLLALAFAGSFPGDTRIT